MTKKIIITLFSTILIITLCLYSKSKTKLETTNLTSIYIDNITIGNYINEVDLTKYSRTNDYDNNYTYRFDELAINVKNGVVNELFSNFIEGNLVISINGSTDLSKIDDVENILGNNFKDAWYDKEQGLKLYTYKDYENKIQAQFIYSNSDNILVWIKLKKI